MTTDQTEAEGPGPTTIHELETGIFQFVVGLVRAHEQTGADPLHARSAVAVLLQRYADALTNKPTGDEERGS